MIALTHCTQAQHSMLEKFFLTVYELVIIKLYKGILLNK